MRQSTKRSLRELIAHLLDRRARLRVKGQWAVKPALMAPEFKDEGSEVFSPASGQSVMTLMRNDVSEFDTRTLGYLVELHNAVPEVTAYVTLLEAQVSQMRGLLFQCRNTMEEAIEVPGGDEPTPIPPAILDRLDAMLLETGRTQDQYEIPDHIETAQPRRRAIRISH
jgi:hypothetical protein